MVGRRPVNERKGGELGERRRRDLWGRARLPIALATALLGAACSSDSERDADKGNAGMAGASAGSGSAGNSGGSSGFGNSDVAGTDAVAGMGSADASVEEPTCAGEVQRAEQIEVDMYVMLDRSGSMLGMTGSGETKWDAIRSALTAFVQDPASDGLGVGLQYFPIGEDGVPEQCLSDNDCGALGGPCLNRACTPPLLGVVDFPFTQCITVGDCPAAASGCEPFGVCSGDDTLACFNLGADGCGAMGDCSALAGGCLFFASCDPVVYATPDVAIDTLPANAMPLVQSLMGATTAGLTPTPPAIAGAIAAAAEQGMAHPERRAIAVLATDGLPTDCGTQDVMTVDDAVDLVAAIAADGLSASPSIRTYVIGVFAPDDMGALANLNEMAVAGGTEQAFLVDATADVGEQFLAALSEIRTGTLRCELQVPDAEDGTLDYGKVNIELTAGGETQTFLYVRNLQGCDQAELGWYYDVDPEDPSSDGKPSTIRLCDRGCDVVEAAAGEVTLEVRVGCKTMGPE